MKKIISIMIMAVLVISAAAAYNPPVGGENLYDLSSPTAISGQVTTAGGALYKVGPESLNVNPALSACEQRVVLNLGYTALVSSNEDNKNNDSANAFGSAMQAGILIPTKMYVYSVYFNGTFASFEEMNLCNSMTTKLGLSKEITEKLDVGLGINSGFSWGTGGATGGNPDFALGANLGFVAKPGNISFMKDFRYGVSILDLGKNFKSSSYYGSLQPEDDGTMPAVTGFPTVGTIRAGASATLLEKKYIKLGASMDITIPGFQNMILDGALGFSFKDIVTLSVSEKINLVESIRGCDNYLPSIGENIKFKFNIKNKEPVEDSDEEYKENKLASYLEKKEWSESEMTVYGAYKNLYKTITAVSAGVDVNLGMKDESAPVIEFNFDDEDEE